MRKVRSTDSELGCSRARYEVVSTGAYDPGLNASWWAQREDD